MDIRQFSITPEVKGYYEGAYQAYARDTFNAIKDTHEPDPVLSSALRAADEATPAEIKQAIGTVRNTEDVVLVSGFADDEPGFVGRLGFYEGILAIFSGLGSSPLWPVQPYYALMPTRDVNQALHRDRVVTDDDVIAVACAATGQKPCATGILNLTTALHNAEFTAMLGRQMPHLDTAQLSGKDFSDLDALGDWGSREMKHLPSLTGEAHQLLPERGQVGFFSDRRVYHLGLSHYNTRVPDDFMRSGNERAALISVHSPRQEIPPAGFVQAYLDAKAASAAKLR